MMNPNGFNNLMNGQYPMNQNQNVINNQNMMMNNQGMMNQMYQMQMMNNQNMMGNPMMGQIPYQNPAMISASGPYQMNQGMNNQNMMNQQQMMLQQRMMIMLNKLPKNINNQKQPNNNFNFMTDGSPNFTGMRIDGEYLREKEDNYSIDEVLKAMNPNLDKNQFYIAVNTRIRQLAQEIQEATHNFELQKQQNPNSDYKNEQLAIVNKMEAVRELSRIIKFYFKEQSEKDAKICRDYTNMDFDGLNGWIPAYTDSNGMNHQGKLSGIR